MRPQDLDDPTPPRADDDVLGTVRNRGRSLQRRRRARRAATAASVVVALGAGVVAITRTDGHHPTVSVEPTTTTSPPRAPVVYERFADDGGLHFSLLLHTPVVAPGAPVRVELVIENRTDHVVDAGCDISEVTVFAPGSDRPAPTMPACHGRTSLASHGLQQDERETAAPSNPGRYLVALATSFPLPQSLLEAMDLQVVETQPANGTPGCTSEVSIGEHPELPAPVGLASLPGLTKISSGAGGFASFKVTGESPIPPECTYAVVGGLGQTWVSSAAVAQYGAPAKVPLPVPFDLAAKHPGPVEVTLDVLTFRDPSSAAALLHNPTYVGPEWTLLPDVSIAGGFVYKVYSAANGGLDEFLVQQVVDNSWMEVAVLGTQLTGTDAVHLAESVRISP